MVYGPGSRSDIVKNVFDVVFITTIIIILLRFNAITRVHNARAVRIGRYRNIIVMLYYYRAGAF